MRAQSAHFPNAFRSFIFELARFEHRPVVMHILFLDPIKNSSRKEHELRDAAARSHAASFAYYRGTNPPKARARRRAVPKDGELVAARRTCSKPERAHLVPAASIRPGLGGLRGGFLNLFPQEAKKGDLEVLNFFVDFTLPGIDVASAVFNNSGAFQFLVPNIVSCPFPLDSRRARARLLHYTWTQLHQHGYY